MGIVIYMFSVVRVAGASVSNPSMRHTEISQEQHSPTQGQGKNTAHKVGWENSQ